MLRITEANTADSVVSGVFAFEAEDRLTHAVRQVHRAVPSAVRPRLASSSRANLRSQRGEQRPLLTGAAPSHTLEARRSGGPVNYDHRLALLLASALTLVSVGCAHVQSSVSASAPHLPARVMAKSADPSSYTTRQPLCPSAKRHPAPAFPRDSAEASWRWPEFVWRASCPGALPVTLAPLHF